VVEMAAWPELLVRRHCAFYTGGKNGAVAGSPQTWGGCSPRDPLDRRPIVLPTMVYRAWAALWAGLMQAWMRSRGIQHLVEGADAAMRSAEHQGLLLALELEQATAEGSNVAAVAVGWSKCCDHLGLPQTCPRTWAGARLSSSG
jgi:hypothetical protein